MRKPVIFSIIAAILVVIAVVITLSVVLTRKSDTKDVVTLNTTTTIPSVIGTTATVTRPPPPTTVVTTPSPTTTVVTTPPTTTVVITPPPPPTTTTVVTTTTTVVITPPPTTTKTTVVTTPPPITTVITTTSTTVTTTISTTTVVTTTTVLLETTEIEITTTINEPCEVEFKARDEYPTGSNSLPVFVSFTDINDDNRPDIIVANQNGNNTGVFFNVQDGYFQQQVTYSTGYGTAPQYLSVVDVNDDNKPDIIVANNGGNSVGVLLNNGSGQFHAIILYPTGPNTYPPGVVVADVNSDQKPDIIVTNRNANTIGVFLNSGSGQFSSQQLYDVPYGFGVMCPQVVDVNGDTHPDIIVANSGGASVGIFFNSGNGTFISWTTFSTGIDSQPNSVFVADVNGDNKPDLIVSNLKTSNVGILLNAGNAKFFNQTIYSTGFNSQPRSVFVADINCDNKPDIIVANSNEENIGILLNFGNGTFQPQITYATGGGTKPWSIAVGNVNDDNKPDIIYSDIANHQIVIFIRS
ncbi:unnamed protein product [Adineta steineri]|uniref:Uncharacterized protein n=1 Tax=Adineta steineri TaxID=433720 RepID=A0A815SXP2_9BILA|nr:unnamed protein product [Adineta steineri]CAF3977184.1 unnamed protein product [Adineta steineri]